MGRRREGLQQKMEWFNLFSLFFSFLFVQIFPYGQIDRLFQMGHGATSPSLMVLFIIVNSIYLGHPIYDISNGFGISLRLPQPPFYQSCGFYLRIYCSLIELTFSYIFTDLFVSFFCGFLHFCLKTVEYHWREVQLKPNWLKGKYNLKLKTPQSMIKMVLMWFSIFQEFV